MTDIIDAMRHLNSPCPPQLVTKKDRARRRRKAATEVVR